MADEIRATFTCSTCGPTEISMENDPTDSSPVFCAHCGANFNTTWGNLQRQFADKAKIEIENIFLNQIKKSNWLMN